MLDIVCYDETWREPWNAFAAKAKNGVFFFHRDYMGYHADRFADHSLIVLRDGKPVAMLPASVKADTVVSHGGLTFGGLLVDQTATTPFVLSAFEALIAFLRGHGLRRFVYKCVPHIYHAVPAEEDRYALFVRGARLVRREVTSTVDLPNRVPYQERRRRGVKKAMASGVEVRPTDDLEAFWAILEETLERAHGVRPVHTVAEMRRLRDLFPDNIKLFAAFAGGAMLAGSVVFENPTAVHAQYIAASDAGKRIGALDAVFDYLIADHYRDRRYFDFGISTENGGADLNQGLIEQKEGFGARAVVHDWYEVDLAA
jgi:Acetyltransferase (GNAT) domain